VCCLPRFLNFRIGNFWSAGKKSKKMAGEKGGGNKKAAAKAQGGNKSGNKKTAAKAQGGNKSGKKAPTPKSKKPTLNLGYTKDRDGKLIPTTLIPPPPVKPVINLGYIPKGSGGVSSKKPLGTPKQKSRTIIVK